MINAKNYIINLVIWFFILSVIVGAIRLLIGLNPFGGMIFIRLIAAGLFAYTRPLWKKI